MTYKGQQTCRTIVAEIDNAGPGAWGKFRKLVEKSRLFDGHKRCRECMKMKAWILPTPKKFDERPLHAGVLVGM